MRLFEKNLTIPVAPGHRNLIEHMEKALSFRLDEGEIPIRLAVASADDQQYYLEVGCLEEDPSMGGDHLDSIFRLERRAGEIEDQFTAVFLVPTGIGAEIGGHAGDATPAAHLLASVCDRLITHPNVVNASDINELPDNAFYVEGSVICRLMMGTAGLAPVRSNRVLVVMDSRPDEMIENLALNTVEAARATYGLSCPDIVMLDPPLELAASYASSGRATGSGRGIGRLLALLRDGRDDYDAVAITSLISVPDGSHDDYFTSAGTMINPWGGIEAMLTHAVSHMLEVPSAHAPMMESREILFEDTGRVDPRMAAEATSSSFCQCVLKGLKRSPHIVTDPAQLQSSDVISANNLSCLIIPQDCLGLPTLAALEQGIPVIAVKEGKGSIGTDLNILPWRKNQLIEVENYWEAAGVLSALRAGIDPRSLRRPLPNIEVKTSRQANQQDARKTRQGS